MPDHQPETPAMDAELMEGFDRWLVGAPLNELEEAIAEARTALTSESLEFLCNCKARVDRRLDAQPERNVFDRRTSCWYEIADALEEEINFRSGKSPKSKAEHPNAQNSASTPQTAETKPTNGASGTAREQFLRPILKKKGFSVHDWAKVAKVDFHTADAYLKGETNPYPSSRRKLASALEIKVEELPA